MNDNPAHLLAVRLKDDSVWKTANLAAPTPYRTAATIALTGRTIGGRPVDETILCHRLTLAWNTLLANDDRPLTTPLRRRYAELLVEHDADTLPTDHDPERAALLTFLHLWPTAPLLGALYASHLLIHAHIGLFGMYPRQVNEFRTLADKEDTALAWLRRQAVELVPGGLTRERMEQHGH